MGENIFKKEADLKVDFSHLEQDLVYRGKKRLLSQFYRSELLKSLLDLISTECQELYDACLDMQRKRTLDEAEGVSLDVLGNIVGADKMLYNYDLLAWFSPDKPGCETDMVDVWVTNAPISGVQIASDDIWKKIILSKIFKNHMVCASAPEIRTFVKMMGDLRISLVQVGVQEVRMVVPATTNWGLIRLLATEIRNPSIDSVYMLPLPPEVRLDVSGVLIAIQDENGVFSSFAPDQEAGKADQGRITLVVNLGGLI